jgi:hypothetical protein
MRGCGFTTTGNVERGEEKVGGGVLIVGSSTFAPLIAGKAAMLTFPNRNGFSSY